MSDFEKTYSKSINASRLYNDIIDVFQDINKFTEQRDPDTITVGFTNAKSSAEWQTIDQIVTNHISVSLEDIKETKNKEIDERTQNLMDFGFSHETKIFSLSNNAQRNWIGIVTYLDILYTEAIANSDPRPTTLSEEFAIKDAVDSAVFPIGVSTKDDGEYDITDIADLKVFYQTGFGTANSHYMSGRALKQLVNDATDAEGVAAVVDNR